MSDLTARAIADLREQLAATQAELEQALNMLCHYGAIRLSLDAELAESKAEANKVTESMGSEILRLQAELEQQRTRAEAAEQELRCLNQHFETVRGLELQVLDGYRSKLAAARARLAGVDVEAHSMALVMLAGDDLITLGREDLSKFIAAAREVLS